MVQRFGAAHAFVQIDCTYRQFRLERAFDNNNKNVYESMGKWRGTVRQVDQAVDELAKLCQAAHHS
jgi:hypothetical protein